MTTAGRAAYRLLLFVAVALLGGCRGRTVQVLEPITQLDGGDIADGGTPTETVTTCAQAFEGESGDLCAPLTGAPCARADGCCEERASCEGGVLSRTRSCDACDACANDTACAEREWCIDTRCQPCLEPEPATTCDGSAMPALRNGCVTALCLPASRCRSDVDCTPGGMRGTCGEGQACACEGEGCCVRLCVPPECAAGPPHPEGCVQACRELRCPSGRCRSVGCRCTEGRWTCAEECTEATLPGCEPSAVG